MNILVLPSYYPDSSNTNLGSFFKEQVKTLAAHGVIVNVIYVEQKSLRQFNFKNLRRNYFQSEIIDESHWKEFRIKGWNIPGSLGERIWIDLTEKLVNKFISRNGKPDIIHAHNVFFAGVVAEIISRKYNIPYVITEHDSAFLMNTLSSVKKKIAQQVYSKASRVISVSKSLQKEINKIVEKKEIEIIPNIVDTDFFCLSENKRHDTNNIKFISIGNLNKNKGHDHLLDAFHEVSKLKQNVTLTICGDGPEKQNLLKKITELNLIHKAILTGHQNKNQILEKLHEADCLVHTSYFETFGIVLIEALSCGVPFIATKCGGPEDVFEANAGFLIDKGDINALVESMINFIDQKDKFSKSELRSFALTKYSRQAVFEKLIKTYSTIVEKKGCQQSDIKSTVIA